MDESKDRSQKLRDISPPEPGALTYGTYLKVPELISLQKPLASPQAHDEMLFIIIHQTYELWFKQIIYELEALITRLEREDLVSSYRFLDRLSEIFRVLVQQIDILETMTPVEFNRFRSHLNPASGFQSLQFREFELLAGANIRDYDRFAKLEPEWLQRVQSRQAKPSLRDAFWSVVRRHGLLEHDSEAARLDAIKTIYGDSRHSALENLCEHLIRFDEQIALWRFRHVQMVERMIGMKKGTGGSLGVAYLRGTVAKRFFPELWEARTEMGGGY